MIREYKTIREISGPLMVVDHVQGVTYDELAEIVLSDGSTRRCKVLEVNGDRAVVPVYLSHTTVVSLWLVMPMAAISAALAPILASACRATASCVSKISSASCSTQPGCGKIWVNSFCATAQISPTWLNRMHRLEVVPASSAMMYLGIFVPPVTECGRDC